MAILSGAGPIEDLYSMVISTSVQVTMREAVVLGLESLKRLCLISKYWAHQVCDIR